MAKVNIMKLNEEKVKKLEKENILSKEQSNKIKNNEINTIEELALDSLFEEGISYTKNDALNNNDISRSSIHSFESWEGEIKFKEKGDGSYLITKDGIAMGWTDEAGKKAYENVKKIDVIASNNVVDPIEEE